MFCLFELGISLCYLFFFFNDTATTEIYTLSLHDALPISVLVPQVQRQVARGVDEDGEPDAGREQGVERGEPVELQVEPEVPRSEEHTSELQSRQYLVCRLLLEKKKKKPQLEHYIYSQYHI